MTKNKSLDNFLYYLIEELNHSFNQKGFWHLTDEGNYYLAVIEHDNGSKIEISDESVDGSAKVTLVIVYPNNQSKLIGTFYQEELTDIADALYEYAVVKNSVKHENRKKGIQENIKPVKSVSRGYDKERTMDITSKINGYLKYPEYVLYSEYHNLYFDRPKVCKIQVFCYGDGRCVVKFPEGDKYEVYNREENDTIFEISSLIKDYFAQSQDLD